MPSQRRQNIVHRHSSKYGSPGGRSASTGRGALLTERGLVLALFFQVAMLLTVQVALRPVKDEPGSVLPDQHHLWHVRIRDVIGIQDRLYCECPGHDRIQVALDLVEFDV